MLDSIDASSLGSLTGMNSAMGRSREEKAAERAEAIRKGSSVQDPKQLETKVRGVAEDFVSVFMNQVMQSMRATVHENPAMHGDNGEKFFQEMLDSEQSKTLAKGSGYGLTDLVYQSLMSSYRVRTDSSAGAADAGDGAEVVEPVAEGAVG